jgi:hypothetical protein
MASTTKKTPPKSPGVVQNPGGGNDQAAVTALTNANAALAKAKASGNKSAIATAQKQAQSAAKTVQSRNQASTAAGLTQTGPDLATKKTGPGSTAPETAPETGQETGQDQLTQLSTAVSNLSSSDSGDFATIQSDLAALAAQLSSDEQTLGNQQSELDALNNGSSTTTGTAGTTSTTSTTSGISSFLGSTTGKIALLGVLAVGGWFYLKNKKKTGGDGTAQ